MIIKELQAFVQKRGKITGRHGPLPVPPSVKSSCSSNRQRFYVQNQDTYSKDRNILRYAKTVLSPLSVSLLPFYCNIRNTGMTFISINLPWHSRLIRRRGYPFAPDTLYLHRSVFYGDKSK